MHSFRLLLLISTLFLIASCDSEVDDQRLADENQLAVVNPIPTKRNFEQNNKNHKVILAVLDSGIDYNHPLLKDNIHFDLDPSGQPTGAGWDFTGHDAWPAPYFARTDFKNSALPKSTQDDSLTMLKAFTELHEKFPQLAKYFPLERNHEEELEETFGHGTHVAGLASFDSPEIGLRAYRVLPFNRLPTTDSSSLFNRFQTTLLEGLDRAIRDGAKVINMSLGVVSNQGVTPELTEFQNKLITIAEENPSVMFVVAAGNEGVWIDGRSSISLPCYIPRKNVICVSSMSKEMLPSDFSNIVINDEVTTIYAWGEDVLSTVPTKSCHSPELDFSLLEEDVEKFATKAEELCSKDQSLQTMSGTSMASPIVARKVAKIMASFPEKSASEIKSILLKTAHTEMIGERKILKLPIELPSWNKKTPLLKPSKSDRNFILLSK